MKINKILIGSLVAMPLVATISCSQSQRTKTYTIKRPDELLDFDVMRKADELQRQIFFRKYPKAKKYKGGTLWMDIYNYERDSLQKDILNHGNNRFVIHMQEHEKLLNSKDITLNEVQLKELAKFWTETQIQKVNYVGGQKGIWKRYIPTNLFTKKQQPIILEILRKHFESQFISFEIKPKPMNVAEAKKHTFIIKNINNIMDAESLKKLGRIGLLRSNKFDQQKHDLIFQKNNKYFILDFNWKDFRDSKMEKNPNFDPKDPSKGSRYQKPNKKVFSKEVGLTRNELEAFSEFWTEFMKISLGDKKTLKLPVEILHFRKELVAMMNNPNAKGHNRKGLTIKD